jgi:hypothetical protein
MWIETPYPKHRRNMEKKDIRRLVLFIWMCFMGYFIFEIWRDMDYTTKLIEAYMRMLTQMRP